MASQSQQSSIKRLPLWLSAAGLAVAISWTSTSSFATAAEPSPRVDGAAGKQAAGAAQPAAHFSAPYTQLLRGAPIKAPVSFADAQGAAPAKIQQTSWHRYGYPSYAFYRGYGGWYGPWYGRGAYGYYGAPYGSYWSNFNRPYYSSYYSPYYGSPYSFSPYYASPYFVGYQPFGAYPFYTAAYYPPGLGLGYGYGGYGYNGYGYGGYGPYGANYGGCCYW